MTLEQAGFLLSIVAIVVSILTALRGNALQARIVAIEEARERDRLTAASRADIKVSHAIDESAPSMRHRLRIENVGAGEATDIAVRVNGKPIAAATDVILGGDEGVTMLASGARFDYRIYTHAGATPPLDVEVEWKDASGVQAKTRGQVRV